MARFDFRPSTNIELLRESATIAVSQRARALRSLGRRIVDLGAGEPDCDTPLFIREAAKRAIDAGHTRYTATEGIPPLRDAIARYAASMGALGSEVEAAEVVVSNGSKQAIFNACFSLFGNGDEVLIPTPAWTSYYEIVQLARAKPVAVFGVRENDLKVDVAALSAAATPRTKGIILNSPSNPTGAVYTADELKALLAFAYERGWWVISDEIYRRIAYNGDATSALAVAPSRENLVVVDGVAKAWAMTGWRVGWSIAPKALTKAMGAFQSHATFHTASVSQHAAVEALQNTAEADAAIAEMVARYRVRRDAAMRRFSGEPRMRVVRPDGAFYLYCDVRSAFPDHTEPGSAFAERLLELHGVAVVPGAAFWSPDWIRMSYAAADESVVEGSARIVELFQTLVSDHFQAVTT